MHRTPRAIIMTLSERFYRLEKQSKYNLFIMLHYYNVGMHLDSMIVSRAKYMREQRTIDKIGLYLLT